MNEREPQPVELYVVNGSYFGGRWDRPQALARAFGRMGVRTKYVALIPALRNLIELGHRNPLTWLRVPKPASSPGVEVCSTRAGIPTRLLPKLIRHINVRRGQAAIRNICGDSNGPEAQVVIIHSPMVWPMVRPILPQASVVCYDLMDDWEALLGAKAANVLRLNQIDAEIRDETDLVFTVSERLREDCRDKGIPGAIIVRNGVDIERFVRGPFCEPPDLAAVPRPRLAYIGTLASWVDVRLLEATAERFQRCSLVLIGSCEVDLSRLRRFSNVAILGPKSYDSIPSYMNAMDVFLNPVRRDPAGDAADPLKIYEYLASGRPTVSVAQPEVLRFSEVISIADDGQSFLDAIGSALQGDSKARQRVAAARANGWDARAKVMWSSIQDTLASKRAPAE